MDECRQNLNKSSISPTASSSSESGTGPGQDDDDEGEEQEMEEHDNGNEKSLLSSSSSPQLDSHNHNNYNFSRLAVIPYQPDLRIIRHVMNMSPSCLLNYLFSLENRLCTLRHERKVLESENAKLRTFFKLQYNLRSNSNSNSNPMERETENGSTSANNNCTLASKSGEKRVKQTNNGNEKISDRLICGNSEKNTINATSTIEVQTEIIPDNSGIKTEDRKTCEIETMTDAEDLNQSNSRNRNIRNKEELEDRKEYFVSVLAPPLKIKESKKSLGTRNKHHSHRSSSSIIPHIRSSEIVPIHALPEPLQEEQNVMRTIRSPTFLAEDISTAVLRNNIDNDDDDNNNEEEEGNNAQDPQTLNVHSISISNTNLRSASTPEIHSTLSSQNLSVNAQPEPESEPKTTIAVTTTMNSLSNSTISTTSTLIAPTTTTTMPAAIVHTNSGLKAENSNSSSETGKSSENPNLRLNEPKLKRPEFQERIEHLIRKSSAILCQNPNPNQNHHIHNEEDADEHTSAAVSSSIFGPLSITGVSSRTGAQSSSSWSDYTDFSKRRRRQSHHAFDDNDHHYDSSSSSSHLIHGFDDNFVTLNNLAPAQQQQREQERPHSLSSIRRQLQFNVQLLQVHRRQQAAGNLIEEQEEENEQTNVLDDHHDDDNEDDEDQDQDPEQEILRPLLGQRNLSNNNNGQSNRSQIQSNDSLHVNVDSISSSSSSTEEGRDRGDAGVSPSSSDSESQSESEVASVHSLFHPSETQSTTLCAKYGNFQTFSRPRPASGHRYVISELLSRKNENKLPSWVPNYAQKIENLLTRYLDEAQANSNNVKKDNSNEGLQAAGCSKSKCSGKPNATTPVQQQQGQEEDEQQKNRDETESSGVIPLDLVYVRLNRSPPPITLLEFDESSEESCIRSISTTKRRKSCLKLSREVKRSAGESRTRPKNLSFSQHVYIADEDHDSKTKSCPGIYYMGEFSIQTGVPHLHTSEQLKRIGILKRRKYKRRVRKMVMKVFHCFRCNSNSNLLQASHIFLPHHGKKKTLSSAQSTTHIPILVDALSSHCQCPQSNYNVSVSKKESSRLRPKSNPSSNNKKKINSNNHSNNEHDRNS